ncbi:MAG: arginine--tRNA ligase [Candidatus Methanoplasma sp.]|jgi:arginyl-tRNA synthetase|nr:arginine--tRNA ligase [Candidatus Methanoplasma sp.]
MDARQRFEKEVDAAVGTALEKIGSPGLKFIKEVSDMADLAVPCFTLSKELRAAPKEIAERLAEHIVPSGLISSVNPLNGYLNFMMDETVLVSETLKSILAEGDAYGSMPGKGIRVNVEHTSTNPTGPIHVGRARNPIIGDTLARSLKRCGYDVQTEYYVNDVGKQVVILTWGVNNVPKGSVTEEDRDKTDHKLVAYYREANKLMEEDDGIKEQISEMLRRFEDGDKEIIGSVRKTAEAMLDGLRETLSDINVELDKYTWESDFIADGSAKDVVSRLKGSKYAGQTEDGAWYLDLKDFGIQGKNTKFTFTRSDGTTLYTTRDLAYHLDKFKRSDKAVDVLGEDQKLGSKQLCSALEILGSDKIPEAMFYSFVSLPEGKMSTRKGVVVYLDDLIDEAVSRAYEEIRSRRSDLSEEAMRSIARKIGIGAIRYNIIRVHPEKQLIFKWNEALNFDGNSGPYLQYVHARACSMLKKAEGYDHDTDPSMLTDEYERALIKVLSKFGSVIREAGEEKRVHTLPAYGHEVAAAFNQFYAAVPVLASDENRNARLTLVECTRTVLRNVLDCLGIDYPEEM